MVITFEYETIPFIVDYDYERGEVETFTDPGYDAEVIINSLIFSGKEFQDIVSDSTLDYIKSQVCRIHESNFIQA